MKLPRTLQNSAIYTFIMFLQKGIAFLLLPLYTYYLTPEDYGVLGVVTSITSFFSVFITWGLGAAAARFYYKKDGNIEYIKKLYGTISLFILLNSLLVASILLSAHTFLIDPFIGEIEFFPYVFLGLLYLFINPLYLFYQEFLQTSKEGLKYGINFIFYFFINVALIVISLTVFHLGVVGVLLSNLIVAVLFFVYVVFRFLSKLTLHFNKPLLVEAARYSLPLLPHHLANWSNGALDRILVNGMRSKADAGLYNLGQQFGSVMDFMVSGINQAYIPWFYGKVNEGRDGFSQIVKIAELCIWGLSLVGLVISIFSRELLHFMIMNPAYDDVWKIVPIVVFALVIKGTYYFFVNILFLKDTQIVFSITLVTVFVNIGANVLLIPMYGFYGCAIACLLSFGVQSLMALVLSKNRNKEIRFRWVSMYIAVLFGFVCSLSSLWMADFPMLLCLLIKTAICSILAAFIIINYQSEIKTLKMIIKKK